MKMSGILLIAAMLLLSLSSRVESACRKMDIPLANLNASIEITLVDDTVWYTIKIPKAIRNGEYLSSRLNYDRINPRSFVVYSSFHFSKIVISKFDRMPSNVNSDDIDSTLMAEFGAKVGHGDSQLIIFYNGPDGSGCGQILILPIKYKKSINFAALASDALKRAGY